MKYKKVGLWLYYFTLLFLYKIYCDVIRGDIKIIFNEEYLWDIGVNMG